MQNEDSKAASDPMDSPRAALVEIKIAILENGVAVVVLEVYTRKEDPHAEALVARFRPVIEERSQALGRVLSRIITGEDEDPTTIPLGIPTCTHGLKMDSRGGNA